MLGIFVLETPADSQSEAITQQLQQESQQPYSHPAWIVPKGAPNAAERFIRPRQPDVRPRLLWNRRQ